MKNMKNMKDLKYYYYSPVDELIGVKTNIKDFSFSYGMAMPYSDKSIFVKSKIKITLNVVKGRVEPTKEDKDKMGKFHYFNGFPNSGEIFYERSFIYKRKLQLVGECRRHLISLYSTAIGREKALSSFNF